jgi:hypothetical protein
LLWCRRDRPKNYIIGGETRLAILKLFINLTPLKHPEKSLIFLGTRFVPLSLPRRGGGIKKEGLTPLLKLLSPLPLEGKGVRGIGSMLLW